MMKLILPLARRSIISQMDGTRRFAFLILLPLSVLFYELQLTTAQRSTAGTFFRNLSGTTVDRGIQHDKNEMILDEEMFRCSMQDGCGYIGKIRSDKHYSMINNDAVLSNVNSILKKEKSGFKDCMEYKKMGLNYSDKVEISWNNGSSFRGYCNMDNDGGGWLVFQRRIDGTEFYRNWTEYVNGFGERDGSFWLGLQALHYMTQKGSITLRIDLRDDVGNNGFAKYKNFRVGNAKENYKLSIGDYIGNIGDSLRYSNGMRFSTLDKDNDFLPDVNCVERFHGPWWMSDCFRANLNNRHPDGPHTPETPEAKGAAKMSWYNWQDAYGTITYSQMMLRVDN